MGIPMGRPMGIPMARPMGRPMGRPMSRPMGRPMGRRMGRPIGRPMGPWPCLSAPSGSTGSLVPQWFSWFTVQRVSGSAGSIFPDVQLYPIHTSSTYQSGGSYRKKNTLLYGSHGP